MDGWGGGQLAGGPMATRCDMIDWGCQRCPAGRRRTATNKGLQRLAVTPPRQRRRHCWSPHQSTKGGGTLAFLIRGEAGRCAGTRCWMPPLISGRPPPTSLSPSLRPPSTLKSAADKTEAPVACVYYLMQTHTSLERGGAATGSAVRPGGGKLTRRMCSQTSIST